MRFPKYPGSVPGDEVVNVTCVQETGKQRPKGVWVRREEFSWLVTFAAMEVAMADGEELFPRAEPPEYPTGEKGILDYKSGQSVWD